MRLNPIAFGLYAFAATLSATAAAQTVSRDSAAALVRAGKHDLALSALEQLVSRDPNDPLVHESLGFALLGRSGATVDLKTRRELRTRARVAFETSVRLGNSSEQVRAILASLPPDGGDEAKFSSNPEIESLMQDAEKAYSGSDVRRALGLYQKALMLDPKLYTAALFSGDSYFRVQQFDSAYIWYARATEISPNIETAWRYWSDVLLKQGKLDDARDKAVQAMIAEPYNRFSISGLASWAGKAKIPVGFPAIILEQGTTNKPATQARIAYDSVRRAWKGTDAVGGVPFKAAFPSEVAYRHSVAEERAALLAAHAADTMNTATINVKKLHDAGVLEAFIFIAAADAGIAAEYDNYRRDFRDVLERFFMSFVIGAQYSK